MLVFIASVTLVIVAGVILSQTKKSKNPKTPITHENIVPPSLFKEDVEKIYEKIKTEPSSTFVEEKITVDENKSVEIKNKVQQNPKKTKSKKTHNRGNKGNVKNNRNS